MGVCVSVCICVCVCLCVCVHSFNVLCVCVCVCARVLRSNVFFEHVLSTALSWASSIELPADGKEVSQWAVQCPTAVYDQILDEI